MVRRRFVVRWILGVVLAGIALYFAIGIGTFQFGMARLLFPRTPDFRGPTPDSVDQVTSRAGNELLIRRYGEARLGCIVFFPGQHGYLPNYDVRPYTAAGVQVLLLAYPGQDGATGTPSLSEIEELASGAVRIAHNSCPDKKVALLGVSLGAMLAAYSNRSSQTDGLVLIAAAPSLSVAIRNRLKSVWYMVPLSVLPVSRLVPYDYTLVEGLENLPTGGAVSFQGTDDAQTPVADLAHESSLVDELRIVQVPGGTHSTTFSMSQDAQIATIVRLLSREAPMATTTGLQDSIAGEVHD